MCFEYFQNLTENISAQPFILFLKKNESYSKLEEFYKLITNEFYDKRNLYAYKYLTNHIDKIKTTNLLNKCLNYYHHVGSYKNKHSFNILTLSPVGYGKNSFINLFLQEKKAKEGNYYSNNYKATKYYHPKYPISIFYTKGFESDKKITYVEHLINKLEQDKNNIDLIFYFGILRNGHTFYSILEIELIKKLIINNKQIIFIYNAFGLRKRSKLTLDYLEMRKDSFNLILKEIDHKIFYPILYKNKDEFGSIESELYRREEYKDYKDDRNYFISNGNKIN